MSAGVPAGGLARVPGVEIFATGEHDGETWTERDLDEILANFQRYSAGPDASVPSPVGIGHEEDQQVLERTDLPAAGWHTGLRKVYDPGHGVHKLVADFEGVPLPVADWINRRLYRRVSAEIYDHPEQAGLPGGAGKMLRRTVLLGAELPKIKTLRDLPLAVYADRPTRAVALRFSERRRLPGRCRVSFFCECPSAMAATDDKFERCVQDVKEKGGAVNPWAVCHASLGYAEGFAEMDRQQLVQAATDLKISQAVIDGLSDELLAQLIADLQAAAAAGAAAPPPPPPTGMAEGGLPDDQKKPDENNLMGGLPAVGGSPSQVVLKYSELDRRFKTLEHRLAARERLEAQRLQQTHQATVAAFCERMVREKRILPADADAGARVPNLYHRLLRADPVRRVHRFGEKGEVLTELELQMKEIEGRDPRLLTRFFGEKMPAPGAPGQGAAALSADRRKELLDATPLGTAILKTKNGRN
jgi:hypothetical protein